MPRRWFQFRLATLLVFVTLSAIGVDYCRRRVELLQFAKLHATEAALRQSAAQMKKTDWYWSIVSPIPTDEEFAAWRMRDRQLAIHHEQLAMRYRQGAWFPWLVVPSEEPPRQFTLADYMEPSPPARCSLMTLFKLAHNWQIEPSLNQ
jgi:hypothetical protein